MKVLQYTLQFIGLIQILLGIVFLIFPMRFIQLNGLTNPPEWVFWLFTMMAARFLGYGIGMFSAAKDPEKNKLWIDTMIMIQAIDWIGTIYYLFMGSVTLFQVSSATFLPIIFIAILIRSNRFNSTSEEISITV